MFRNKSPELRRKALHPSARTQTIRIPDSFEVPYLAGDGHTLVVVCAAIRIGGESLHSGG